MFVRKPPPRLSDAEKELHPSWRRDTRKYHRKRRIVRTVWLVSGALMLVAPLGLMVLIGLTATFVSLMILDETA